MNDNQDKIANFSPMLGGPLYQFYLWTGLVKKPLLLYKRRIIIISLFAWLPLFILTLLNHTAFSHVDVPFIYDIDVHMRFLISLPLLIYAEVMAHEWLKAIVKQFLVTNIITEHNRQKYNAMIASSMRLTNSMVVESVLLFFVIVVGHSISNKYFPLHISSWYATNINGVSTLTTTGLWYAFISLPLFQFMLLRWYYHMFIWYRFLWQVSRLPLQLNSLHPDKTGGIGFLNNSLYAFEALLLAHSTLLAGMIFNRIINVGAKLSEFQAEIICMMLFLLMLPLTPLLFFIPSLLKTKRYGTLDYDVVANYYVNEFRKKWIESSHHKDLLGSSDIQSLADLTNSFNVSAQMRILPLTQTSILTVIFLTALPLLPLVFTIMPVEKIIVQLFGIVF